MYEDYPNIIMIELDSITARNLKVFRKFGRIIKIKWEHHEWYSDDLEQVLEVIDNIERLSMIKVDIIKEYVYYIGRHKFNHFFEMHWWYLWQVILHDIHLYEKIVQNFSEYSEYPKMVSQVFNMKGGYEYWKKIHYADVGDIVDTLSNIGYRIQLKNGTSDEYYTSRHKEHSKMTGFWEFDLGFNYL